MIAHKGEAFDRDVAQGREGQPGAQAGRRRPRAGARHLSRASAISRVGNTYYMALMAKNEKNPEQKEWGAAIKPLFPNANDRGSHVNISGMALAKYAPNKANALKLMEFLASEEAQKIYATANNEYPVNPQGGAVRDRAELGHAEARSRCRSRTSPSTARRHPSWSTRSTSTPARAPNAQGRACLGPPFRLEHGRGQGLACFPCRPRRRIGTPGSSARRLRVRP